MFKVTNYSLEDALNDSDCVVLHTCHKSFKNLRVNDIRALMKEDALVVDTQHIFPLDEVLKSGLKYRGIGRGGIKHH